MEWANKHPTRIKLESPAHSHDNKHYKAFAKGHRRSIRCLGSNPNNASETLPIHECRASSATTSSLPVLSALPKSSACCIFGYFWTPITRPEKCFPRIATLFPILQETGGGGSCSNRPLSSRYSSRPSRFHFFIRVVRFLASCVSTHWRQVGMIRPSSGTIVTWQRSQSKRISE